MLILLMIILFFAVIISFYKHYNVLGSIGIVLLVIVQVSLLLDSQYHYATKLKNNMVVSQIAPITSIHGNHIMVIKKVNEGRKIYHIFITKNKINLKNNIIMNKDKKVIVNKTNTKENRLITNNYRYKYTNKLVSILFAGITNQNQIERQVISYDIGNNWYLLNEKKIKSVMGRLRSEQFQNELTVDVKVGLQKEINKNPNLLQEPQKLKNIQKKVLTQKVGLLLKNYESEK